VTVVGRYDGAGLEPRGGCLVKHAHGVVCAGQLWERSCLIDGVLWGRGAWGRRAWRGHAVLGHERSAATAKLAQLPSGRRGRRSGEHKEEGRNFGGRGRKHMSAELDSANEEAKVSYECDCVRGVADC